MIIPHQYFSRMQTVDMHRSRGAGAGGHDRRPSPLEKS